MGNFLWLTFHCFSYCCCCFSYYNHTKWPAPRGPCPLCLTVKEALFSSYRDDLWISWFNCSVVSDSVSPWTAACQAYLSITNSWSLFKLMSIELVMPSNHLILCHPLLLLPSITAIIRVFSSESVLLIRCPKYWRFSFSISLSSEYSVLISFRMDWFDLLAVQGTLKSSPTPEVKNINSSVLSFLYSPTLTSIHDY